MSEAAVDRVLMRGPLHNYRVAGRVCNAFVVGAPGSDDAFFLVGALPSDEADVPLVTAHLVDTDGTSLCRLVRNVLVSNPGRCAKVLSAQRGYTVRDADGATLLAVDARLERLPGDDIETFVTRFSGRAMDAADAMHATLPGAFGFGDGFGAVEALTGREAEIARLMLASDGALHRVLTGPIDGQPLSLDGAIVWDAQLTGCRIGVSTGDFVIVGTANAIRGCNIDFRGAADRVRNLVLSLMEGG